MLLQRAYTTQFILGQALISLTACDDSNDQGESGAYLRADTDVEPADVIVREGRGEFQLISVQELSLDDFRSGYCRAHISVRMDPEEDLDMRQTICGRDNNVDFSISRRRLDLAAQLFYHVSVKHNDSWIYDAWIDGWDDQIEVNLSPEQTGNVGGSDYIDFSNHYSSTPNDRYRLQVAQYALPGPYDPSSGWLYIRLDARG